MISDAELIALWHTKESRSKIAARVQMSRKELQREWRRLQIAGTLPMGERISSRRHYATTPVVDGRPRVGVLEGDDLLLKRLRQEYEDDG
jgi:chorismate-pyruvate lyase